MGISDILKKAVVKGAEFLENIADDITAPKPEETKKNSYSPCDKGDCLYNNGTIYHTCSDMNCPRIKFARDVSNGEDIIDPVLWPYMKRLEEVEADKSEGRYEKQADFMIDLLSEYMPQYKPFFEEIGLNFIFDGITRKNKVFNLLWDLKDKEIFLSSHKMEGLVAESIGNTELHLQYDFYRNPSLYLRNDEDFDYTVKIFETVSDPEKLSKFYIETDKISISQFFDNRGNIKPAGFGGEEKGFSGDTIWKVVESWDEFERPDDK